MKRGPLRPVFLSVAAFLALSWILLAEDIGSGSGDSAAERLIKRHMTSAVSTLHLLRECPVASGGRDELSRAVAAGIVATESSLRHSLESVYEDPIVWLGRLLDYPPPNLSLGPAQISPAHYKRANGNLRDYWATVSGLCKSLAWVTLWVNASGGDLEQAKERQRLFASWSGHLPAAATEFETAAYFMFSERVFWRARRVLSSVKS